MTRLKKKKKQGAKNTKLTNDVLRALCTIIYYTIMHTQGSTPHNIKKQLICKKSELEMKPRLTWPRVLSQELQAAMETHKYHYVQKERKTAA